MGPATNPPTDDVLMMLPDFLAYMTGSTYFSPSQQPRTLIAMTRSKSSTF
jgi:hypothetical protein